MRLHSDERGVIVNWLVRILLILGLVGVVLYDAGAMMVNYFTLDSTADEIAIDLKTSSVGDDLKTPQEVEARARELAKEAHARLTKFEVDPKTHQVTIVLRRAASTLVVSRVGQLEKYNVATATAKADRQ